MKEHKAAFIKKLKPGTPARMILDEGRHIDGWVISFQKKKKFRASVTGILYDITDERRWEA